MLPVIHHPSYPKSSVEIHHENFSHLCLVTDVAVVEDYRVSQLHPVVEPLGLPTGGPSALGPRGVLKDVAMGDEDFPSPLDPGYEAQRLPGGIPAGSGLPASQLDPVSEPQEHARNVAAGDGNAASQLDAHVESVGNRTGPRQRKYEAQRGKLAEKYSKLLQKILKDLERAADVAEVDGYPASQLDAVAEPPGLPRGRPRALQLQGRRRGYGYPAFRLFPVPEPQDNPQDVADIDGHAASQLDPHFEPQDGRARKSRIFSFFESFHVTDTISARYLVSFTYLELYRAYPASQLDAVAEPPGLPRGVPAGRGLPGSLLDPTSEPQEHARNVAIGGGDLSSHLDSDFESLGNLRVTDVPEGSVSPGSQGLKPLLEPWGNK
ncbi:uncharacterized protein LOC135327487 [Dromaius novaehollandiae]|uniref:uncharacterized protein LOC135327487 n=1 Tax=Dromaius novaehollandiae TaxID=8790 RepID=UPI00311F2788